MLGFGSKKQPRELDGRFGPKEGAGPDVSLEPAASRSRSYEDIDHIPNLLESYRRMQRSCEDGGTMDWFNRTFSGDVTTRLIELADKENAGHAAFMASSLIKGDASRTPGGGFKETWTHHESQTAVAYDRGQPVDEFDEDVTVTLVRTTGGVITVKQGAHGLVAVGKNSAIRVVFEPGATGKVISASGDLELVAPAEVEAYGLGRRFKV
jgi:hypothetical protein